MDGIWAMDDAPIKSAQMINVTISGLVSYHLRLVVVGYGRHDGPGKIILQDSVFLFGFSWQFSFLGCGICPDKDTWKTIIYSRLKYRMP